MSQLDTDNWQHKLGMIEGCLRAYSAPQEVMHALAWMKDQLGDEAEQAAPNPLFDCVTVEATKRPGKKASEPIPLTPTKDEVAARARGYMPHEEALIIKLLREGASISTIADHFPKKAYQTIYAKVTTLKSSGRV